MKLCFDGKFLTKIMFNLPPIRDHLTVKTIVRGGRFREVPLHSPPSLVHCVPSEDVSSPPAERCVSRLPDAVFHRAIRWM